MKIDCPLCSSSFKEEHSLLELGEEHLDIERLELEGSKGESLIIKGKINEWNAWWSRNRDVFLQQLEYHGVRYLATISLDIDHLRSQGSNDWSGIHLTGLDLTNADFRGITLNSADFRGSVLHDAKFAGCKLIGASFRDAYLNRADLSRTDLRSANLRGSWMPEVKLRSATLYKADLERANLTRADLENADLSESLLRDTNLRGAKLERAILDGADLREVRCITFDENSVRSTRFGRPSSTLAWIAFPFLIHYDAWKDDQWSILRREYTGARFAIRFLAAMLFLIPYAVQTLWLVALSKAEHKIARILVAATIGTSANSGISPSAADQYLQHQKSYKVWEILVGLPSNSWPVAVLVGLLIVNGILRYSLLQRVVPLRDVEDRTHVTPRKKEYLRLFHWHFVAYYLGWLATLVFTYNMWKWMTTTVYLP